MRKRLQRSRESICRRWKMYHPSVTEKRDTLNIRGVQNWEETEICDTLNIFDTGEIRTPILIVQEIKDEQK